jgi:hypothetical protein
LSLSGTAFAGKRVALVIGNGAYIETPPLGNPKNDASDMTVALKRLEFEVLDGIDLDKRGMERLIREFDKQLAGAEIALFFYAGHGMQVSGQNYLVPTDARLKAEGDIDFESLPLSLVLTRMEREAGTSLVLLDACRDNPLARNLARTMGTRAANVRPGLAEVRTGVGTLIGFSTQPGNVALDGRGRNSPYTTALLRQIETPGRDVMSTLAAVTGEVVKATSGTQVPWQHASLTGPVVLKATPESVPVPSVAPTLPPASAPTPTQSAAAEAWLLTKDTSDVATLEAYIRRYGDTYYGDLAKARLENLKKALVEQQRLALNEQKKQDEERKKRAEEAPSAAVKRPRGPKVAQSSDENIGPTPSPSPTPSPTPTPGNVSAFPAWTLELFNVDDQMVVEMNGTVIATVGFQQFTTVSLNKYFVANKDNRLRLRLTNNSGGWTYGFRIKVDDSVAVTAQGNRAEMSCGQIGVKGCNNNDGTKGVVFTKGYIWHY